MEKILFVLATKKYIYKAGETAQQLGVLPFFQRT